MADADADDRIGAQGDLESRLRPTATRTIDTSASADAARAAALQAYETALAARRAAS